MPDQLQSIVERMVAAGEPEENIALVIKNYQAPAAQKPAAQKPSAADTLLSDNPAAPLPVRATQALARFVKRNPEASGSMVAGTLAAPLTGGMSLLPAAGVIGGASALGAGAGQLLSGQQPDLGTMAEQGVSGALGHGVGAGVTGALKLAGRGLYRAAALPINKFGKYGDLITEGLEKRVPVSKSGLAKAEGLKAEAVGAKKAAVADADTRAVFRAKGIADDAEPALRSSAMAGARAAQGNVMPKFEARLEQFTKANPDGSLTPSALEGVKGTLDDTLGGAYKKLRMKEPLTPQERFNLELSQASSRAQESVIPNYRGMNRNVMNAEGLRQMIQRRVSPGSSGGNQGLENAMTIVGGLGALPARIAMLPPVTSRAGIAANEMSKAAAPVLPPALRAFLALLAGGDEQ